MTQKESTESTQHVKVDGDLHKRLKDYMETHDRSANWILKQALDKFLPPLRKTK